MGQSTVHTRTATIAYHFGLACPFFIFACKPEAIVYRAVAYTVR